jgi:hypothetical protein
MIEVKYHKIHSIFKRDPDTNHKTFLTDEYSRPEFEYLANNRWIATEKIDGTNIRVKYSPAMDDLEFGGKSDNAQIPAHLMNFFLNDDAFKMERFRSVFLDMGDDDSVVLFGEGYGLKIQKGGDYIKDGCGFILFDVWTNGIWLNRESVVDIATKIDIPCVEVVGRITLKQAITIARDGFKSLSSELPRQAEGLVLRPETELLDRRGRRIITKIKHKDFIHEVQNDRQD